MRRVNGLAEQKTAGTASFRASLRRGGGFMKRNLSAQSGAIDSRNFILYNVFTLENQAMGRRAREAFVAPFLYLRQPRHFDGRRN